MTKRAEQRGYHFEKLPMGYQGKTQKGVPKMRYTWKEVEELKNVKASDLYKHATMKVGGKTISGTEARRRERAAAAKKGWERRRRREYEESRGIIAEKMIQEFQREANYVFRKRHRTVYPKAMNFLQEMLHKYDRTYVGETLMKYMDDVKRVYMSYDEDIDINLSRLAAHFGTEVSEEDMTEGPEDEEFYTEENQAVWDIFK